MKKQLYILTLLSLIVLFVGNYAFAEGSANIKIGLDVSGDQEISLAGYSQSGSVETGFSANKYLQLKLVSFIPAAFLD